MKVNMPFSRHRKARLLSKELRAKERENAALRRELEKVKKSIIFRPGKAAGKRPPAKVVVQRPSPMPNGLQNPRVGTGHRGARIEMMCVTSTDTDPLCSGHPIDEPNQYPLCPGHPIDETDRRIIPITEVNPIPINIPASPMTATRDLAKSLGMTPRPDRIKTLLPFTIATQQVKASTTAMKKALFQTPVGGKKCHGTVGRLAKNIALSPDYIFKTKQAATKRIEEQAARRVDVTDFLKRQDNSYELPDKKNEKQFALADTMTNLHRKFCTEYVAKTMSIATFMRYRPSYIKLNHYLKRSVCLCKIHANISLFLEAVPTLPKSTQALVADYTDEQITEQIQLITSDSITYQSWEKVTKKYQDRTVSYTKIMKKTVPKEDFVKSFIGKMPAFREHCERVHQQYIQCQELINNLPVGHCVVQMDYAENWNTSYFHEISAAYYTKTQVTLHPMVTKVRDQEGNIIAQTYCGVTSITAHSFPTTLTFIDRLVTELKKLHPYLTFIHFITDSPSSQYRNRFCIQMLSRFQSAFNLGAAWNWLESGHGKGPCDGVGGTLKRLADRIVKQKILVQDAEDFFEKVNPQTKVILIELDDKEVETSKEEVKSWESPSVRGLNSIHQATCTKGKIVVRPTSCYRECCFGKGELVPECSAWLETKVVEKGEEEDEVIDSEAEEDEESGYETADETPLAYLEFDTEEMYDDVPLLELIPLQHLSAGEMAEKAKVVDRIKKGIEAQRKAQNKSLSKKKAVQVPRQVVRRKKAAVKPKEVVKEKKKVVERRPYRKSSRATKK